MKRVLLVFVFMLSIFLERVGGALPPDVMIARFKDDCQAAVSLTFDDAVRSHVETAIPVLDRYGLKGTFFILVSNVRAGGPSTWDDWRHAVANGHEAGSHSLTHPLLTKVLDQSRVLEEIAGSADVIEAKLGIRPSAFAYPESDSNDAIMKMVKSVYAFDRSDCRVWGGDGFVVADGIRHLEQAVKDREWFYCMLHGVGESTWGQVDPDILEGLAKYLDANRDQIWTDTYSRVSSYVQKRNAVKITLRHVKADSFDFRLMLPDDRDYARMVSVPLTVKVALDGRDGQEATANRNGQEIELRPSTCGHYLLLDLEPDGGWVEFSWK